VSPRAGLEDMEKRKFLTLLGLELRFLGRPARSQSLYRLRLWSAIRYDAGTRLDSSRNAMIKLSRQRVLSSRFKLLSQKVSQRILRGLLFHPDDGGSIFLTNVGGLLAEYIALHPRR
jgi:hypothetical protein